MTAKQIVLIPIFGLLLALPHTARGQAADKSKLSIFNSNEILDTTYGEHGGLVIEREQFRFESVVDVDGIRIYVYEAPDKRLDPGQARGTVRIQDDSGLFSMIDLRRERDDNNPFPRFRSKKPKRGFHLFAPADFSLRTDGRSRWRAVISGLPGQTSDEIRYSLQFGLTRLRAWCCRGHQERIFFDYKDYPLCDREYLDETPFLYQCPQHANSRSDRESTCPLCKSRRVPTVQSRHAHFPPQWQEKRRP